MRLPYAAVNVADSQFGDHKCATAAIDAINNAAAQNQPSFIAVGFRKPHLAFLAPPAYYALYILGTFSYLGTFSGSGDR